MLLGVSHSFRHGQHFGEPHTENDPRDACGKLVKLDPRFFRNVWLFQDQHGTGRLPHLSARRLRVSGKGKRAKRGYAHPDQQGDFPETIEPDFLGLQPSA
jgi:hypothetical protein